MDLVETEFCAKSLFSNAFAIPGDGTIAQNTLAGHLVDCFAVEAARRDEAGHPADLLEKNVVGPLSTDLASKPLALWPVVGRLVRRGTEAYGQDAGLIADADESPVVHIAVPPGRGGNAGLPDRANSHDGAASGLGSRQSIREASVLKRPTLVISPVARPRSGKVLAAWRSQYLPTLGRRH